MKGRKLSKEHKLNISLSNMKHNPNYKYCGAWLDREYKRDLRKDYCENADCKNDYERIGLHHIYLDKKRCAPDELMTLCNSCHAILHRILEEKQSQSTNPKDYIIINRPDHVSYIHKKSKKIITIKQCLNPHKRRRSHESYQQI